MPTIAMPRRSRLLGPPVRSLAAAVLVVGALVSGLALPPATSAQVPVFPSPWQYYGNGYGGYPIYGYCSPVNGCANGMTIGNGYPSPFFPYNNLGANQQYPAGQYDPYYYNYYGYGYPAGYSYNQGVQFTNTPATGQASAPPPGPPPSYNTGGVYCTDSSGGSVWVPAGGPTTDLTCPPGTPGAGGTSNSSGAPAMVAAGP